MKIIHFCAGLEEWNGMANTARQFVDEERAKGDDSQLTNDIGAITSDVDQVVIHGAWLPVLWKVAKRAKAFDAKLLIRPAGSYDPVRLAYHGWKKRLVALFEHRMLRRTDVLLATCEAEAEWIKAYEPKVRKIEITDLKRFFDLNHEIHETHEKGQPLHLLYLGRRHPLKGVQYLEEAVRSLEFRVQSSELKAEPDSSQLETRNLELKIISSAFGDEKEKVWDWCDVLVLPTLSENFGRVVAEALERGKRVITTDGAPAWGDDCKCRMDSVKCKNGDGEIWKGYDGRLIYLKGYREGTREERIVLIQSAIEKVACQP